MLAKILSHRIKILFCLSIFVTIILLGLLPIQNLVSAQSLTTLPPYITFLGGWDQGVILGNGAWNMGQWMAPDRFQLVTSPVRKGPYSVRVEVRPGDDPINAGGERSEVSVMRDLSGNLIWENENSGTQYYAVSVYLPLDWKPPSGSMGQGRWGTFFQLHGPDVNTASPAFELDAIDRFHLYTMVGDLDYLNVDPTKSLNKFYEFSDGGALNLGKWNDFVIKIKFAKTYTGTIDIWHRVEGQTTFDHVLSVVNVPTLQYKTSINGGAVGNHYWKTGYYRSKETYTNVLWVDSQVRGSTFDDVVAAAFPTTAPVSTATATRTLAPTATQTFAPTATRTLAPTATQTPAPSQTPTKAPKPRKYKH